MAIFESSAKRKPGTRSNTKLVVSGGASPAGQWVTDPNLPMLFHYEYGGPGQKEIVVAKGLLVGVAPERHLDDALGYKKNALTIANANVRPFGMAPYNFSKHWEDFLDGNQPSVITREYVELPLIRSAEEAALIKWGAAYHGAGDANTIKPGDLVTWSRDTANAGKIIKFNPADHKPEDVIGQVGEIEDDQEPFGWLKWAMWDETARKMDTDGPVNKSGYDAPSDGGYPYDPAIVDAGRNTNLEILGQTGVGGYLSQYTTENDATGINGLLDGRQKAQTVHERAFTVPAGTTDGTTVQLALGLKNIIDQTVQVFLDGTETSAFSLDSKNGVVGLNVEAADASKAVTVKFRAEFFGTPAGWDHKGAVGVVRILLKF